MYCSYRSHAEQNITKSASTTIAIQHHPYYLEEMFEEVSHTRNIRIQNTTVDRD